jgi:hypothetical protein
MSPSDFEYRLARNDAHDSSAFCRLSNSLYARPVDERYYSWQFFDAPFRTQLALALDREGELAGCYGLQVRAAEPGGISIGWVIDIMVAPRYQRQGLLRALSEFAASRSGADRPAGFCVMANDRADAAYVKGLGWQRINIYLTYARATVGVGAPRPGGLELTKLESFAGCESLLDLAGERIRASRGGPYLSNRRSVPFLEWRFLRNPRYAYDIFLARRASGPFGLLVLKVFRDPVSGRSFGDLVDLIWVEDDPGALAEMLAFALTHFRERGVPEAAVWLQTNSLLDRVGLEAGFSETGLKRYFCGKVLDERVHGLGDAGRWFLTMADSEVY